MKPCVTVTAILAALDAECSLEGTKKQNGSYITLLRKKLQNTMAVTNYMEDLYTLLLPMINCSTIWTISVILLRSGWKMIVNVPFKGTQFILNINLNFNLKAYLIIHSMIVIIYQFTLDLISTIFPVFFFFIINFFLVRALI